MLAECVLKTSVSSASAGCAGGSLALWGLQGRSGRGEAFFTLTAYLADAKHVGCRRMASETHVTAL